MLFFFVSNELFVFMSHLSSRIPCDASLLVPGFSPVSLGLHHHQCNSGSSGTHVRRRVSSGNEESTKLQMQTMTKWFRFFSPDFSFHWSHQDVQWNDLDYADKRRVFTFDPRRFGDLPGMVEEFHRKGLTYILILVGHLHQPRPASLGLCLSWSSGWQQVVFVTASVPGPRHQHHQPSRNLPSI